MRHRLPPRPHLDHLKKQAKELLRDHAAREPAALDRFRESLPAVSGQTHDQVAAAAFALHDAQSVIAREYGFDSWSELRTAVAAHGGRPFSEANMRMLMAMATAPIYPAEVFSAIREADREAAALALKAPWPTRLPLVAVRDVIVLRPSVTPLSIARPFSIAAVQEAWQGSRLLAIFSQHTPFDEQITAAKLHTIGSFAYVHRLITAPSGVLFAVIEALRAAELSSLDVAGDGDTGPVPGAIYAHLRPFELQQGGDERELAELEQRLRETARKFAGSLPEPDVAIAMIDELDELELANAVVQSLPRPTAEKALFAAEPKLIEKLRLALSWSETLLQV